jgi:hypothetical protein
VTVVGGGDVVREPSEIKHWLIFSPDRRRRPARAAPAARAPRCFDTSQYAGFLSRLIDGPVQIRAHAPCLIREAPPGAGLPVQPPIPGSSPPPVHETATVSRAGHQPCRHRGRPGNWSAGFSRSATATHPHTTRHSPLRPET